MTTQPKPAPETDDELRARIPRAPGESDQVYLARLDAARADVAIVEPEPADLETENP